MGDNSVIDNSLLIKAASHRRSPPSATHIKHQLTATARMHPSAKLLFKFTPTAWWLDWGYFITILNCLNIVSLRW